MSTRNFQPGDGYGIGFTVKSAAGALVNADSPPTAAMYRNGAVDNTVTVTVSNSGTGVYQATCTIPAGYAPGDRISLLVDATIAGIATGEFVDHIRLVGWPNAVGGAGGLATTDAAGKTAAKLAAADVTGNLPAIVEAYAAGEDPASLVLANPSQKLYTDAAGNVRTAFTLATGTVGANPSTTTITATFTGIGSAVKSGDLVGRRLGYLSGTGQSLITDGCTTATTSGGNVWTFTFSSAQKEAPAQSDTIVLLGY